MGSETGHDVVILLNEYIEMLMNTTCKHEPIHNAQFCFQTFRLALNRTVIDKQLETSFSKLLPKLVLSGAQEHTLPTDMYCAALPAAALRCAALRYSALRCASLRSALLRCAALRCDPLRFPTLC